MKKRTRNQIQKEIAKKEATIEKLTTEIIKLNREDVLFSDKNQWFEEKMEVVIIKSRPKITEEKLIGRVYWNEDFVDKDTNKTFTIQRQRIVLINGEWQ